MRKFCKMFFPNNILVLCSTVMFGMVIGQIFLTSIPVDIKVVLLYYLFYRCIMWGTYVCPNTCNIR